MAMAMTVAAAMDMAATGMVKEIVALVPIEMVITTGIAIATPLVAIAGAAHRAGAAAAVQGVNRRYV